MDNFKPWELNTELRKFLQTCLTQQWKRSKMLAVLKKDFSCYRWSERTLARRIKSITVTASTELQTTANADIQEAPLDKKVSNLILKIRSSSNYTYSVFYNHYFKCPQTKQTISLTYIVGNISKTQTIQYT